jgi:MASE6
MDSNNIDRRRKRHFFIFLNICMIPILVFLTLINYFNQATLEFIIDLVLFPFLIGTLLVILRYNVDEWVYRVTFSIWFLLAFYSVAIGSGYGTGLYWILVAPVIIFYFFEKKEGLIWNGCIMFLAVILVLFPSLVGTYTYDVYHMTGFFGSFVLIMGIGYGIETNRHLYSLLLAKERDSLSLETERLKEALDRIKTLNGMLPICSYCKKIRDDEGYWQQVESYIHDHTDAELTHGICPECSKKYYADENLETEMDEDNE